MGIGISCRRRDFQPVITEPSSLVPIIKIYFASAGHFFSALVFHFRKGEPLSTPLLQHCGCLPICMLPQQAAQDLNGIPALTVVGPPGNVFHVRTQGFYDIIYAADIIKGLSRSQFHRKIRRKKILPLVSCLFISSFAISWRTIF